ncbi:fasciclin domain-containing protein [Echinicola sediminis]
MKSLINIAKNIFAVGAIVLLTASCDLALQKEWEYVREPFGNQPTGLTAYEWLQEINGNPTYNDENGLPEFEYLLEAIEKTGLQELYDDPNAKQTYFLLRNNAFNGAGQLMEHTTGNSAYPLDSISNDRLEHALRYHIVDKPLAQGDIPKNDFFFYYQTLVPGDTGVVEINKRLWDQSIRINSSIARIGSTSTPSNMPSTSRGRSVDLHNFIFTNGVGHQLNGYVRYQPF